MTSRKLWICNDCDVVFVIAPARPNAKCRRCDNVAWVCPDDVISWHECAEMIRRGINRAAARLDHHKNPDLGRLARIVRDWKNKQRK